MLLKVLTLTLQVLLGVPLSLTVDEMQYLSTEKEPEEVDGRLLFHTRDHTGCSSKCRRLKSIIEILFIYYLFICMSYYLREGEAAAACSCRGLHGRLGGATSS